MKIACCVKRVPATTTQIKIAADGTSLDPAGVEWILNPYDEISVEEALRVKEKNAGSEVVVISVGPTEASTVIRTCLAMGADRGVLLKDDQPVRDSLGVAHALADHLKTDTFDLIYFGKQAVDDDNGQVASMTATLLGLPVTTVVTKIEYGAGTVKAHREIEGGREIVAVTLPGVFATQKGLNEPRYPSLKGIMAAKKKTIEEKPASTFEPTLVVTKMEPPAARPAGRIVGKGPEAVPELVRLLREEAKVI